MLSTRRICLVLIAVTISPLLGMGAKADTNRATFPADFDKYVLYATYDRGSSKEEAFALPETIAFSKSGKPLPAGTRLILGIWADYKLTGYFVMHKGVGWGLEVEEERRTGDWHFQQFGLDKQVNRTAITDRCESCHQSAERNDFMFTIDRMRDYLP
ncbi:cytochrome P460 family protein [Neorhizobium galegae]|uniref:cytochrome P460 family protein n=1 Tax=Neorhizobium galegae TaxID=399 RepID=UPI002107C0E4|nr:cytochrome P460 family protein [Neorhizobium galegae]MCQ1835987.1 cytochrome P460 family protein [Neorhizobium galegae]UIY28467.1 cytochrome P460 family protein [Neorhizobium galegae]